VGEEHKKKEEAHAGDKSGYKSNREESRAPYYKEYKKSNM